MMPSPAMFLVLALSAYVAGMTGALLLQRWGLWAGHVAFGFSALAAASGLLGGIWGLASGPTAVAPTLVWPTRFPGVRLVVQADALSCFFVVLVSLLGLAIAVYSLGYVAGYAGHRNVGLMGAMFNGLLLATTVVFVAGSVWMFLIGWELTALLAYGLVTFEHENRETRQAGVLYFIMSHVDAFCVALGFFVLFQAAGDFQFDNLKRLLAYHSIENIGIILMGLGASLMFVSGGHPVLAALALAAGLYHCLNHAAFKGLLFLGAGAVLHATHTRNMEEMGGLVKRMPQTAGLFLLGAVAISALPPLNGFVSEWLTYQALLQGFGTTESLWCVLFPLGGAMLALTGALAAACFWILRGSRRVRSLQQGSLQVYLLYIFLTLLGLLLWAI